MALNYSTNPNFTGRITAPDGSYPYGSSIDESSPGADDGTPYIKQRADDLLGFQQALLTEANIIPNGSSDTAVNSQYMEAAKVIFKSGRENLINNGEFRFWDNGVSFVSPAFSSILTANKFVVHSQGSTTQVDRASNSVFTGGFEDGIIYSLRARPNAGTTEFFISQDLLSNETYRLVNKPATVSVIVNSNENCNLLIAYYVPESPDYFSVLRPGDSTSVPLVVGDNEIKFTFDRMDERCVNGIRFELRVSGFTPGTLDSHFALIQFESGSVNTDYDYKTVGDDRVNSAEFDGLDYFIRPNGLIIQKGNVGIGPGSNVNITFPITFPNAAIQIVDTIQQNLGIFEYHGNLVLGSGTLSTTGCTVHNGDTTYGGTYSYIVMGY